jgi:hypothetical protein
MTIIDTSSYKTNALLDALSPGNKAVPQDAFVAAATTKKKFHAEFGQSVTTFCCLSLPFRINTEKISKKLFQSAGIVCHAKKMAQFPLGSKESAVLLIIPGGFLIRRNKSWWTE